MQTWEASIRRPLFINICASVAEGTYRLHKIKYCEPHDLCYDLCCVHKNRMVPCGVQVYYKPEEKKVVCCYSGNPDARNIISWQ